MACGNKPVFSFDSAGNMRYQFQKNMHMITMEDDEEEQRRREELRNSKKSQPSIWWSEDNRNKENAPIYRGQSSGRAINDAIAGNELGATTTFWDSRGQSQPEQGMNYAQQPQESWDPLNYRLPGGMHLRPPSQPMRSNYRDLMVEDKNRLPQISPIGTPPKGGGNMRTVGAERPKLNYNLVEAEDFARRAGMVYSKDDLKLTTVSRIRKGKYRLDFM